MSSIPSRFEIALAWLRDRFELSRGETGGNVRSMEGMRGLAVFFVFLVHFATLVSPWLAKGSGLEVVADGLHTIGMSGVDLFFVLSGYLIYGSLMARDQPFKKFMGRRYERIYPAFLAVFVIYLGLSFVFPAENKIPTEPWAGLVYIIQNLLLLPGLFPIRPVITVAWSLSYEMFYYFAIPVVISVLSLRSRSSLWRVTMFGAIAALTAIYCAVIAMGPIRLIMFISGIFLFEATRNQKLASPGSAMGATALLASFAALLVPIPGPVSYTLKICALFICFFIFCFACFKQPDGALAKAFCWTPLRWLGNMSYSYYLIHGLALKAGFHALPKLIPQSEIGAGVFGLLLLVMFLLTLIPATLLFLLIERPFSLSRHTARSR